MDTVNEGREEEESGSREELEQRLYHFICKLLGQSACDPPNTGWSKVCEGTNTSCLVWAQSPSHLSLPPPPSLLPPPSLHPSSLTPHPLAADHLTTVSLSLSPLNRRPNTSSMSSGTSYESSCVWSVCGCVWVWVWGELVCLSLAAPNLCFTSFSVCVVCCCEPGAEPVRVSSSDRLPRWYRHEATRA